ncbi:MAG: metallophosphatase family protein [Thermoflexales bacterium]|nr:metallophosphatase family protein [Thermoflexales bacterium]MDW8352649.1 metallophosphoesterase family protein [Anaerolineae bacterium]
MRAAIFSDIHGNVIGLEAVLDDIASAGGVDEYWILGDLAALGPSPVAALERLNRLPNARFVRGNTDRYVCGLLDPQEAADEITRSPASSTAVATRLAMLCWTQGALVASGWLGWMATLPLEQRLTLPNGARVLLVHAAPGTDDGLGIRPTMTDDQLAAAVEGCAADLVFTAHTHWQLDRTIGDIRVVNLGSVSNPWAGDLRASYYLLEADEQGYRLEHRRVAYDRDAVIAQLQQMNHPGVQVLSAHLRGERQPPWA